MSRTPRSPAATSTPTAQSKAGEGDADAAELVRAQAMASSFAPAAARRFGALQLRAAVAWQEPAVRGRRRRAAAGAEGEHADRDRRR